MNKSKKLLSMGIAMTMSLIAMTGCSIEKIEDTPSTTIDTTNDTTSSDTGNNTTNDLTNDNTNTTVNTATDFDQLAPPEAGETIATITVAGFGEIKLKFFPEEAPLAVENFVTHAENGYYDGIIFHRVIDDFMIQGGDPTGTGMGGSSIWGEVFDNEDSQNLYHFNGALSMANAGANTNGSQFFIVNSSPVLPQINNDGSIDYEKIHPMFMSAVRQYSDYAHKVYTQIGGSAFLDGGYTVFGQVYEGLDIVQEIMLVEKAGNEGSTPIEDVVIESIIISQF